MRTFSNKDSIYIGKESEKAIKELANIEWIQIKISTGEKHLSLNSHKSKEIKEYIIKILRIDPAMLG